MPRKKSISFQTAFDHFMRNHAKPYLKSASVVQALYRRYLRPLGQRKLNSITRLELQALHAQIGVSAGKTAANRALEVVRAVYNKAIDWELYAGSNPARRIRRFRLQPRERFLLPTETDAFFSTVETLSPSARDFFLLALFTGVRKSNLLEMRWSDVSWPEQTWRIGETKNGSSHVVPLIPQAIEILKRRRRLVPVGATYVFHANNNLGHLRNPYKSWRKLCARAGLSDLRIHDLRRSMGSWQALTGANLSVIGKTLNHTHMQSTAIYARVHLEPVRQAMNLAISTMIDKRKVARQALSC